MTALSLNDILTLINQRLDSYETLRMYLAQSKALMEVAVSEGFLEQQNIIQHDYLWACRELLVRAYDLNEKLLNEWLSVSTQNNVKIN